MLWEAEKLQRRCFPTQGAAHWNYCSPWMHRVDQLQCLGLEETQQEPSLPLVWFPPKRPVRSLHAPPPYMAPPPPPPLHAQTLSSRVHSAAAAPSSNVNASHPSAPPRSLTGRRGDSSSWDHSVVLRLPLGLKLAKLVRGKNWNTLSGCLLLTCNYIFYS